MSSGVEQTQDLMVPAVIAKAIVDVQKRLKPLVKTATNDEYDSSYTPLDVVTEVAHSLLARRHKIAVMQPIVTCADGSAGLKTMLVHESGVGYAEVTPLAMSKAEAQAKGSSITYERRYDLMSMLGFTAKGEDDDGNKASGIFLKPTDEQIARIKSLCQAMNYARDQVASRLWTIKTRDHATLTIIKLEKLVSERARDIEARDRALEVESTVTTDIEVSESDSPSDQIQQRINALGLAGKKEHNAFVHSFTGKPFLVKCDDADLEELRKTLDLVESGKFSLPKSWYPAGQPPVKVDVTEKETAEVTS
ncbi:ERF family protein [Streptomyces iakyrus]|uniref:ERF family protein n=1 Tax=Streptomyces iakyrus TaxID=68219 RepID=UPI0036DFCC60